MTVLVPFVARAFVVPERPNSFVQDYAGVLSAEDVSALETKTQNFERATTNEIAVVVIPSLDGDTVENVAQEIFTKWGIGKAEKNNGVLFLIAIEDRKTRIHTGYGVEGDLTDLGTSYIQQDIVAPAFREGDYAGGINGAVDKMIEALSGSDIVPENYNEQNSSGLPWDFIIFLGFVFTQLLVAILGRSKAWWHGGVLGGVVAVAIWYFFIESVMLAVPTVLGLIGFGLFVDYLASKAHGVKESTGMYPWWFGGGGGGSSGGGGFGGFGGGMSGGGGSSGSW